MIKRIENREWRIGTESRNYPVITHIRSAVFFLLFTFYFSLSHGQQKTYCNPLNLDYGYTPIPNFSEWGRHRATADPVIVLYKGDYYLFSTNQWGRGGHYRGYDDRVWFHVYQ